MFSFPNRPCIIWCVNYRFAYHIIQGHKLLYLRIEELEEKWNKPIANWNKIQEQLIELFGERFTQYIEI